MSKTILLLILLSGCTYPPSQGSTPPNVIKLVNHMDVSVEEFCYKGFKYALIGSGNGRVSIAIYTNAGRLPMRCDE